MPRLGRAPKRPAPKNTIGAELEPRADTKGKSPGMGTQATAFHNPTQRSSGNSVNFPRPSAEVRRALTAWTRAKANLQQRMRREDFQAFIRPVYLLSVFSPRFLLLAIPPNRRIVERLRNFRHNLNLALAEQGYGLAGFTSYPSDDELLELRNHPSFRPFVELIYAKRLSKLEAARAAERIRVTADLFQGMR